MEAYKRLSRRFQPRFGQDPRSPAALALQARRLKEWFATQPWSPTCPENPLYEHFKSKQGTNAVGPPSAFDAPAGSRVRTAPQDDSSDLYENTHDSTTQGQPA